jgi:GT2 family glycosyltransferase
VLFLDDDIRAEPALIAAHHAAHQAHPNVLVAGRVIQPWQEGRDFSHDAHFHFAGLRSAWIDEFMGGNFSLRREAALELGGFDENFVKVAYRFEAEFAHRLRTSGGRIYFEPAACLHHLKAFGGGTRTFGDYLTTWRPDHAVGAYYFALRTRSGGRWLLDFVKRPIRAVVTRHHLRHPWWIPVTCLAELCGMGWALILALKGPRLVRTGARHA